MADVADTADEAYQYILDAAVAQARANTVIRTGRCLNCDEKLDDGRAYCDESCREDHEDREGVQKKTYR